MLEYYSSILREERERVDQGRGVSTTYDEENARDHENRSDDLHCSFDTSETSSHHKGEGEMV